MNKLHCPYRQSVLLQQALSPDKMKIAFLLGAGCPVSIEVMRAGVAAQLIPDIKGLTSIVLQRLAADPINKESSSAVTNRLAANGMSNPTIEDFLTHIRSLHEVVGAGSIDGLNKESLGILDETICDITTEVVGVDLPSGETPYHQLAMWVRGIRRTSPIEIFTPNYDLLVEQALEWSKSPYFDGFVGSRNAFFDLTAMETEALPPRWTRLWKLHGSVNWWRIKPDGGSLYEVVRSSAKQVGGRQMIYPSHLKYDQSRRLPYLAMLDRLRAFLSDGQSILITCGYSFVDQHLNEVIMHGLRSNPTAMCFGLLYGDRGSYSEAVNRAKQLPNLSLLAADGAVLGAREADWQPAENGHPLEGVSVQQATVDGAIRCRFLLGDFKYFGNFLANQFVSTEFSLGDQYEE